MFCKQNIITKLGVIIVLRSNIGGRVHFKLGKCMKFLIFGIGKKENCWDSFPVGHFTYYMPRELALMTPIPHVID